MASSSRSGRQLGPAACRVCGRRELRRRLAAGQVNADAHGSVHGTAWDGDYLRGEPVGALIDLGGGLGATVTHHAVLGVGVPVRNVSPGPNERDYAGQTGKSPMTSS